MKMHVLLTENIHTMLHRYIYKHKSHLQKHINTRNKKNVGLNWKINVWIGLTFIFMYLCIFLPHFGLEWYTVVQFCITSLAEGKSAASSFNKNIVS